MTDSSRTRHFSRHQRLGAAFLFCGISLLTLILLDALHGFPWSMPRTWYEQKVLWGVLGLVLCAAGWKLQRNRRMDDSSWRPAAAGRRFSRLIVYSRPECHLCDDAKAVLAGYAEYLPRIEDVDIDQDATLQERFGTSIPVIEIDGIVRFRGHVDEMLLRRLIDATPTAGLAQEL